MAVLLYRQSRVIKSGDDANLQQPINTGKFMMEKLKRKTLENNNEANLKGTELPNDKSSNNNNNGSSSCLSFSKGTVTGVIEYLEYTSKILDIFQLWEKSNNIPSNGRFFCKAWG